MSVLDVTQLDPEQRRPIKRAEYHAMGEVGLFQGERVELLDGVIVRMRPRSPPHDSVIERLTELLVPRLLGRARVRIRLAFAADDYSEPEPDVAIVSKAEPRSDHPARAHLVVEVSASSLRFDRSAKAAIYARAGVPAYFIVNVDARCVEAYLTPQGGRYTEARTYRGGEPIEVPGFCEVTFSADDLFEE